MEIQEGGELLKVLHTTLGRRVTKVFVWIFAFIALIFALKWGIEGIDWLMGRFALEAFNLPTLLGAFVSAIIAVLFLVAFGLAGGFVIAIPIRLGVDLSQRRKVEKLANSLIELLKSVENNIPQEDTPQIQSFILQAESIKRPPIVFRILDKLFGGRKKK